MADATLYTQNVPSIRNGTSVPRIPTLMRTWMPNGKDSAAITAATWTLCSQWELEDDFDLIRFVYSNPGATAYTIQLAKVAVSTSLGDGTSPTDSTGATTFAGFSQVFFNNAGADVSPQDQTTYGSGTATLTVTGGATNVPIRMYSDWVRIPSVSRIDGGTRPILMARHLSDNAGTYRCASAVWSTFSGITGNPKIVTIGQSGVDSVTTPAALSSPVTINLLTPDAVQYYTRSLGFSVVAIGDSLTQGYGGTSSIQSWAYTACLGLSTVDKPISFWNQGWQGQTSTNYWSNGYTAIKGAKPDVAVISVWSPNDGLTQATADAGWSRAMDLTQYCIKQGITPVLMGPLPWGNITTAAQETARLSVRTRMLNAWSQGIAVLDWENTMGTQASPNRIRSDYLNADGLHPNDLGNSAMDQAVFRRVLAGICGIST